MTGVACGCPNDEVPCTDPATQEDLLCDHCRNYCAPQLAAAEEVTGG